MPKCPFATWKPISGSSGPYLGGPFRIVHHTTEGASAQGAMDAFAAHRSDPHFTVDGRAIWQHVDTGEAARALRNLDGGVETNRWSAVQIELVGFAGARKDKAALTNLTRLCRWIESQHQAPRVWPNGPPRPPLHGGDPGGHNRDPVAWTGQGGHYGHCHVPENVHWDPAYDSVEAAFVLAAEFGADGVIANPNDPSVKAFLTRTPQIGLALTPPVPIAGHADVGAEPDADD